MTTLLIAGASTRAAADSAARAGFDVTAIDAFADLDQHPGVRALSLPRDFGTSFSAGAAARLARKLDCTFAAYTASFENHPAAVGALADGRTLLGNGPHVLRRARDPWRAARAFASRGFRVPGLRALGGKLPPPCGTWLLKPIASGGGARIRICAAGTAAPPGFYVQEFIDGLPGSLVFAAARGRAVPLGVSRQLVGEPAFGARPFRYCGSILLADGDVFESALVRCLPALAEAAASAFDLAGLNGIDFVASGSAPYPLEINPRWTASAELVERAYRLCAFGIHAGACQRGVLPAFDLAAARRASRACGKAIVFARRTARAAAGVLRWLDDPDIRDVPRPGERIRRGRPVCTVFAEGANAPQCLEALAARAATIYAEMNRWPAQ